MQTDVQDIACKGKIVFFVRKLDYSWIEVIAKGALSGLKSLQTL